MNCVFTFDNDQTLATVETDAVPRRGEQVRIQTTPGCDLLVVVTDVRWRVVGRKLHCFVQVWSAPLEAAEDLPVESCWVEADVCLVSEAQAEARQDVRDYVWLDLWCNPKTDTPWWIGAPGRCRPLNDVIPAARVVRWRRKEDG